MIDTVKEAFDIEVQNPVVSPAPLASNPDRLNRRLPRPIPIGVRMKVFFQDRLQVRVVARIDAVEEPFQVALNHREGVRSSCVTSASRLRRCSSFACKWATMH
jgi:hypothetical protein